MAEDYYTFQNVYPYKNKEGKRIGWKASAFFRDADGRRKQKSKVLKATLKRDALSEGRAWVDKMNKDAATLLPASTPRSRRGSEPTVAEMVRGYLDFQLGRGELEKSTYSTQVNNLDTYIAPTIGSNIFAEVDKVDLEGWITDLYNVKRLSSNTIHTVYALLNKVYRYYYHQGTLKVNPCEFVKTPKKGDTKVTYLDEEQVKYLLECRDKQYERGDYMWTALGLALYGGLRREEICGLRWYDVDFAGNRLFITSAVGVANDTEGKRYSYTKNPKNRTSKREFPLIPSLRKVLEARHKAVQEQYGTVVGTWFVIGDTIHYKPPTTLSTEMRRFTHKYDIREHFGKYPTLHSLRHNFATYGVNKTNMDIASLTKVMGHASKAMTLDTYSTDMADAMNVAMDKLGQVLNFEEERPEDKEDEDSRSD